MKSLVFLAAASLLTAGCQSNRLARPANPDPNATDHAVLASRDGHEGYRLPPPNASALRVMTYNTYLGADLSPVMKAGNEQDFLAAAFRADAELHQTNFPARVGKIADQIAKVRPDILGLDEAALWSLSVPYKPGLPPGTPFVTQYDVLQLVIDSLRARDLAYVAASADTTSDIAAPVPMAFDVQGNPTAFALVRFQDRDAILVRAGVPFRDPRHGKFAAFIPLHLLGTETGLYRGWCSIMATMDRRTFRYVNSHLEAESPDVNLAQAAEMVRMLQNAPEPVIWAGDFNVDANTAGASYALITGAGFTDLWPLAHPRDPGLTNGAADGVGALNAAGVLVPYASLEFNARIDLVLLKNRSGEAHGLHAALFGIQPNDRTASGLFPSDHAAVGMVFELPKTLDRP